MHSIVALPSGSEHDVAAQPAVGNMTTDPSVDGYCIPNGHSCQPEWLNPTHKCCSRFCFAIIGGVGGWCI
ncbi:hypothetical protein B0H11DRAFT_2220241 [Mycena galericulata]|nr:hypothetical protein B0H11DRAFT_2222605 [Mycena galericulata]KAJ7505595.1 hypothetical protein B0H11DRAFT_2220241 [Mycena galericulata]